MEVAAARCFTRLPILDCIHPDKIATNHDQEIRPSQ
jgi:hypothetical protein